MQKWNNYDVNYNRKKKLPKPKRDFNDVNYLLAHHNDFYESLANLNTNARKGVYLIDSNICVYSDYDKAYGPITPVCFKQGLSKQCINKSYHTIKKYIRTSDRLIHEEFFPTPPPLVHEYIPKGIDEDAVNFLYDLTSGNEDTLINLAKICYHICRAPYNLNRPIIILAEESLHSDIISFFSSITNKRVANLSLNDLLKNGTLIDLYVAGLNSNAVSISTLGEIPKRDSCIYRIKTILTGGIFNITNPYFTGKLHIKNRAPFVFVTDKHLRFTKFKHLFNAYDLVFDKNTKFNLKPESVQWLKTNLIELGEKWIICKKCNSMKTSKSNDDIISAFIKQICSVKDDYECEKNELYKAFCEYYKHNYSGKPLGQISFGKQIKNISGCTDFRRHLSEKIYPWFFKGIKISPLKWKRFIDRSGTKYGSKYNDFKKFITEWLDKKAETKGIYVTEPMKIKYHICKPALELWDSESKKLSNTYNQSPQTPADTPNQSNNSNSGKSTAQPLKTFLPPSMIKDPSEMVELRMDLPEKWISNPDEKVWPYEEFLKDLNNKES